MGVPWLRLVKAIAILLGSVLLVCVVLPILIVVVVSWLQNANLSNLQHRNVDWVIRHAYPGSDMIRADGQMTRWRESITVDVKVMFDSPDTFDVIKAWYVQHPQGGKAGGGESNIAFPEIGLEMLNNGSSPRTLFRVTYDDWASCDWFDFVECDQPAHRIR